MGPVLVSNLCTVGEAGATTWVVAAGSARSEEADGIGGSRVPLPGEVGLARC